LSERQRSEVRSPGTGTNGKRTGRGIPSYKDLRKQWTRAFGGTRDDYPIIKDYISKLN
jgi:hypothetical protein